MPGPSGSTRGVIQQFDPVPHRGAPGAVEVALAADVGADDELRLAAFQGVEPVVTQLARQFGLGQRIGTRRAATHMAVRDRRKVETQAGQ